MELRYLRYFVAVGKALNFTKAAMPLHLARRTLSRQARCDLIEASICPGWTRYKPVKMLRAEETPAQGRRDQIKSTPSAEM
jgi:hypothetical protein